MDPISRKNSIVESSDCFRNQRYLPQALSCSSMPYAEFQSRYPQRAEIYRKLEHNRNGLHASGSREVEKAFRLLRALNHLSISHQEAEPNDGRRLRDHQILATEAISDRLEQGHKCGYVKHPCATGKTITYANFLQRSQLPALILQPSQDLVRQCQRELNRTYPTLDVGLGFPLGRHHITVVTDASALAEYKKAGSLDTEAFDILIPDEAHKMLGKERRKMIEALKSDVMVLGYTATDRYYSNRTLVGVLGEPWHTMTLDEAVVDGIIPPLKVTLVQTDSDLSRVKVTGRKYNPAQLSRAIHLQSTLDTAIELFQKHFADQSAIIPCGTVRDAKAWAAAFNAEGIPAAALYGSLSKAERIEIIGKADRREIKVLTGKNLVVTGLDLKHFSVLFNAVPTISAVDAEQRLGRILRIDPDRPDKVATVVEFLPRRENRKYPAVLVPDLLEGRVNLGKSLERELSEKNSYNKSAFSVSKCDRVIYEEQEVLSMLQERTAHAGSRFYLGGKLMPLQDQLQMAIELRQLYSAMAKTISKIPLLVREFVGSSNHQQFTLSIKDKSVIAAALVEYSASEESPVRIAEVIGRTNQLDLFGPDVQKLIRSHPARAENQDSFSELDQYWVRFSELRQNIAHRFLPLVTAVASERGSAQGREVEELEADLNLVLIEAIHLVTRKEIRGLERFFLRELKECEVNSLDEGSTRIKDLKHVQQAFDERLVFEKRRIERAGTTPDEWNALTEGEEREIFCATLSDRDREIMKRYFESDGTVPVTELAKELGFSTSLISSRLRVIAGKYDTFCNRHSWRVSWLNELKLTDLERSFYKQALEYAGANILSSHQFGQSALLVESMLRAAPNLYKPYRDFFETAFESQSFDPILFMRQERGDALFHLVHSISHERKIRGNSGSLLKMPKGLSLGKAASLTLSQIYFTPESIHERILDSGLKEAHLLSTLVPGEMPPSISHIRDIIISDPEYRRMRFIDALLLASDQPPARQRRVFNLPPGIADSEIMRTATEVAIAFLILGVSNASWRRPFYVPIKTGFGGKQNGVINADIVQLQQKLRVNHFSDAFIAGFEKTYCVLDS